MMGRPVNIYHLKDPRTSESRYVGKTVADCDQRLCQHSYSARNDAKTPCHRWFKSLLDRGLKPILQVVEVVQPGDNWAEREMAHIAALRASIGSRCLNVSDGGDGLHGVERTAEWRERASRAQKGRLRGPLTLEHRQAIARGNTGKSRALSAEHRAKLRAANLGRTNGPLSDEHREKLRAANLGKAKAPLTVDQKAKWMAALMRGSAHHQAKLSEGDARMIKADHRPSATIAAEYSVSRATVNRIKSGRSWAHV